MLRRIESEPGYGDLAPCRACLGGFADVASFCASTPPPDPGSSTCVELARNSNTEPLVVYFRVSASSTPSAMATAIQASFENLPSVDQNSWSGAVTVTGPDNGVYQASYPIDSLSSYEACKARLEQTTSPSTIHPSPPLCEHEAPVPPSPPRRGPTTILQLNLMHR